MMNLVVKIVLLGMIGLSSLLAVASTAMSSVQLANPLPGAQEGQNYSAMINISREYSGDPLTFSLINGPRGLRVSAGGRITWQPDYNAAGSYTLTVKAGTDFASTLLEIPLQVEDTNRPPVFTSAPRDRVAEGGGYNYRIHVQDPDGDPVSLRIERMPEGMQFIDNTLTWQPGYDDAGIYTMRIVASDHEHTVYQEFNLSVQNTNRAPVIATVDAEKLSLQENQPWQLRLDVSDPDGDTVKLELLGAPQGMTLDGHTLNWRPSYDQAGNYRITVKVSDGTDSTNMELKLDVANVNRLPNFISQPVTNITETEIYRYEVRAFDPDGDVMLRHQLEQGPEGMVMQGSTLIWQTSHEHAGEYPVVVSVSDAEATVKQSFALTVINKNREPFFRSSPVTRILETELFEYRVEVEDADGDPVKIEVLQLPKQISWDGETLRWQTDYFSAGSYPVHIRASDAESSVDQRFVLEVVNVNRKPVITSTPALSTNEAFLYQYRVESYDEDKETLTYSLQKSPTGMRIEGQDISWRPNFNQAGKHPVVVAVSDGIDAVTQAFVIDVANTNREPVLAAIDDQQVTAGEVFSYTARASDPDGDPVSITLINQPDGMDVDSSNRISWRTSSADIGTYTILVSASDGDLRVRRHFELTVLPPPAVQ